MKELIKIERNREGKETVDARELHKFLEVKSEFRNWIKNRISDFSFTEGVDFIAGKFLPGSDQIDYHLTLDMAKELSMLERNDKGKQARLYFIEREKQFQRVEQLSPAELILRQAQQLVEYERRVSQVEDRLLLVESKQKTVPAEYFSIAGYCNLKGVNVDVSRAGILGRKCTKLSHELGYEVGSVKDERYGKVNTYHIDVLSDVI
jgi:phage anti-repressor protein